MSFDRLAGAKPLTWGGKLTAPRRGRADVIAAAFEVVERDGLDGLTLREVARRLGAHLNTVSFQVGTKARLLELMADQVLGELDLNALPDEPLERVRTVVRRYRGALLARRDGARLVAGTNAVERNTLRVGNAIVEALIRANVDRVRAVRAFWGLHFFLIGLVQEEQSTPMAAEADFAEALGSGDYPSLAQVGDIVLSDAFDQRFEFGVEALLRHAALSSGAS